MRKVCEFSLLSRNFLGCANKKFLHKYKVLYTGISVPAPMKQDRGGTRTGQRREPDCSLAFCLWASSLLPFCPLPISPPVPSPLSLPILAPSLSPGAGEARVWFSEREEESFGKSHKAFSSERAEWRELGNHLWKRRCSGPHRTSRTT